MIRKAKIGDVKDIQKLLTNYASQGQMLSRSLSELYEALRDFYVFEDEGRVVGTADFVQPMRDRHPRIIDRFTEAIGQPRVHMVVDQHLPQCIRSAGGGKAGDEVATADSGSGGGRGRHVRKTEKLENSSHSTG